MTCLKLCVNKDVDSKYPLSCGWLIESKEYSPMFVFKFLKINTFLFLLSTEDCNDLIIYLLSAEDRSYLTVHFSLLSYEDSVFVMIPLYQYDIGITLFSVFLSSCWHLLSTKDNFGFHVFSFPLKIKFTHIFSCWLLKIALMLFLNSKNESSILMVHVPLKPWKLWFCNEWLHLGTAMLIVKPLVCPQVCSAKK